MKAPPIDRAQSLLTLCGSVSTVAAADCRLGSRHRAGESACQGIGGLMAHEVQVFSTQGVPGPRKVEMWNSILGELADAVHVQPRDPLHFDGTLIRQRVGPMTLFEVLRERARESSPPHSGAQCTAVLPGADAGAK